MFLNVRLAETKLNQLTLLHPVSYAVFAEISLSYCMYI